MPFCSPAGVHIATDNNANSAKYKRANDHVLSKAVSVKAAHVIGAFFSRCHRKDKHSAAFRTLACARRKRRLRDTWALVVGLVYGTCAGDSTPHVGVFQT